IRFAAQLGFELAPDLVPAMHQMRDRLTAPVVSVERVADELKKMLVSERPKLALELLDLATLLEVILPELAACKGVQQGDNHLDDCFRYTLLGVEAPPPAIIVHLAAAFHDVGKPATAGPGGTFTGHDVVGAEMAAPALDRLGFPMKDREAGG